MIFFVIFLDAFWSGIAALGFAILFNVPRRVLYACVLCGALGHAMREVAIQVGLPLPTATLVGSSVVGFMAIFLARYHKMPSSIFAITGAIPMVPGVFAFRTMIYILQIPEADNSDILLIAARNGVMTGLVLAAIAIGIAAPRLIFLRPKPVV